MPASFHPKGRLAVVQLVNDTDCAILVEEGTVVGTSIPAEECGANAAAQRPAATSTGTYKARKVTKTDELPEHLKGLFQRSSRGLAGEEKEALKQLLIELRLVQGTLYYVWLEEDGEKELFVVPRPMRDLVKRLAHDNTLSGHFGMMHTHERVLRQFWWPGVRRVVEDHVRACSACNRSKHLRRKYRAPSQEVYGWCPHGEMPLSLWTSLQSGWKP
jgi:hypothetical protein